jgi:heme-degrading monooxygenase HmoA
VSCAIVWQFEVAAEHRAEFERVYSAHGDWAQLFRQADGFIAVELLRDETGTYLAIDRWRSHADYDAFRARWAEPYAALDRRCEALTLRETPIGHFEVIG